MSQYHTQAEHQKRQDSRRTSPRPIESVGVFFHIALMPGWESIVLEQLKLLSHVGLKDVKTFMLGSQSDVLRCVDMAAECGVSLDLLGFDRNFSRCEAPTLRGLRDWAVANIAGAVVYLHSKGVSTPADHHKQHWRRVMMKYVVSQWQQNLKLLEVADMVGCGWQDSPQHPHYCGNFWMARADWVANLRDVEEYRYSRPDFKWGGWHSWQSRFYAETWIGSEGYHYPYAHLGIGARLWTPDVFSVDAGVAGFSYDDNASWRSTLQGDIAVTHPGKIGDALYALPTVRWLCNHHGGKADFYSLTQFAAMKPLLEQQDCLRKFVPVTMPCRDPNTDGNFNYSSLPVQGKYAAVYHLGFKSTPDRPIPQYIAVTAGATGRLPVTYQVPEVVEQLPGSPFVVVAPGNRPEFRQLFTDFVKACPYPVIQVGAVGEAVVSHRSVDMTGVDYAKMAAVIAKCKWFFGTMSSPLVIANGFPCIRVAVHDGQTWDMRHVCRSDHNHYPVNPTVNELFSIMMATRPDADGGPVKALYINSSEKHCGVYQYGMRTGRILTGALDSAVQWFYGEAVDAAEAEILLRDHRPDVVLLNWHPSTMPWFNTSWASRVGNHHWHQYGRFLSSGQLNHDCQPAVNGVHAVLQTDSDAVKPASCTTKFYATPRPLAIWSGRRNRSTPAYVTTIGSFGLGCPGKGFDRVVKMAGEQFDQCVVRLHIPPAHYSEPNTNWTLEWMRRCEAIRSQNVRVEFTSHFMEQAELLDWLAGNDINVFLYDQVRGAGGCSSVPDIALAVDTPLAVSESNMFRLLLGPSSPFSVEQQSLKQILEAGPEPVRRYRQNWSAESLRAAYRGIATDLRFRVSDRGEVTT